MGNSPTQKPFEGDPSEPGAEAAGAALSERVVSAVRSLATTVRSKCSVFSNLDFADAFRIETEDVTAGDETAHQTPTESPTPSEFPARDQPFTHPVRERDAANPPELRAREDADTDELSIYYPDRPNATITSDTWEDVER